MLGVAIDHLEEVVGRFLLVGEDVGAFAELGRDALEVPRGDVGGNELLAALQDDRAHAARAPALVLYFLVDVALRGGVAKRDDASALAADLEQNLGAPGLIGQDHVEDAPL